MKVYILFRIVPHEFGEVVGVYGTKDLAEAAKQECVGNKSSYDDSIFEVHEWEVVEPEIEVYQDPKVEVHRDPNWTQSTPRAQFIVLAQGVRRDLENVLDGNTPSAWYALRQTLTKMEDLLRLGVSYLKKDMKW